MKKTYLKSVIGNINTKVVVKWYALDQEFADKIKREKVLQSKTNAFRGNPNDCDTYHFKDGSTLWVYKDRINYAELAPFKLFKGFKHIGDYTSIVEAKNEAPSEDGIYNLIGLNYRDSWQISKGQLCN